jgi:small GTP-binding protein
VHHKTGDFNYLVNTALNIALVGNPNSGKSSLFNALTGLNQKVGNFPGVTVDKKTGSSTISENCKATIIDLPGTYSLYPKRADEWVAYKVLLQQDADIKPDMIVLVADASNLKRNLLFCSQIIDLKIPLVIALSMMDLSKQKGIKACLNDLFSFAHQIKSIRNALDIIRKFILTRCAKLLLRAGLAIWTNELSGSEDEGKAHLDEG